MYFRLVYDDIDNDNWIYKDAITFLHNSSAPRIFKSTRPPLKQINAARSSEKKYKKIVFFQFFDLKVIFHFSLFSELRYDVALPHDGVLLAVDLDLRAAVFGKEDFVADGHGHRDVVALVVASAWKNKFIKY